MVRKEQIADLMTQVGPILDPLGVVGFPKDNSWGVQLDQDTSIIVDFDEQQSKLVLSCDVGLPPAGDRLKLYELLLRHNFHWDETGGTRLAIDAADGNIILVFDLPADEVDVTRMSGVLRRFGDAADAWREIVKQPLSGPSESTSTDPLDFTFIRV